MAKATAVYASAPVYSVTLELTAKEATTLRDLSGQTCQLGLGEVFNELVRVLGKRRKTEGEIFDRLFTMNNMGAIERKL